MITEDYVSFETAKLLKDKGFNERLLTFYITDEFKKEGCFQLMAFTDDKIDNNHSDHCYLAPTLQMAMKWLREVQNLFIFPFPQVNTSKFWVEIYQLSDNQEWENLYCESIDLQDYSTYEQACEAAIKYCLENLI